MKSKKNKKKQNCLPQLKVFYFIFHLILELYFIVIGVNMININ